MISKKAAAAAELAEQCRRLYLPMPTHYKGGRPNGEFRFHATRLWRFDCAWTDLEWRSDKAVLCDFGIVTGPKLALEIDGGVFLKDGGGRHNRGAGYRNDTEKLNEAIILGWYVMRCLPEQIRSGEAVAWIERFMFAHHVLLPTAPPTFHRRNPHEPTQAESRTNQRHVNDPDHGGITGAVNPGNLWNRRGR